MCLSPIQFDKKKFAGVIQSHGTRRLKEFPQHHKCSRKACVGLLAAGFGYSSQHTQRTAQGSIITFNLNSGYMPFLARL